MRIISYGFERWIQHKLILNYPLIRLRDPRKILKLYQQGDFVLFSGWNKMDRKVLEELRDSGIPMFPDADTLLKFTDRRYATQFLDEHTLFSGQYTRHYDQGRKEIPDIGYEQLVLKLGDHHVGKGKYIKQAGDMINSSDSWILEPFIKGRSLRVLILKDNYSVIEHVNNQNWIKNIDPESEIITLDYPSSIVKDALNIAEKMNSEFLGIDYQLGENNSILPLEINVLPGCPDSPLIEKGYFHTVMSAIKQHS
ncbi:hypothetical protein ABGV42_01590 [Paenibacillus pabuli]|uniref:hypothetical protein n=1 Tax=Paenibacillus pabuli TaxID=1472 RepID=UPI00324244F2